MRDDDVPVGFGATVLGSTTVSDTIIKNLFCITIFHYCTDDFLALFSMSMILGRSFGRAQRWVGQSGWRLFLLRSRGRSLYSRRRDCKLFSWNYILKKLVVAFVFLETGKKILPQSCLVEMNFVSSQFILNGSYIVIFLQKWMLNLTHLFVRLLHINWYKIVVISEACSVFTAILLPWISSLLHISVFAASLNRRVDTFFFTFKWEQQLRR